jgi:hypothetical protein
MAFHLALNSLACVIPTVSSSWSNCFSMCPTCFAACASFHFDSPCRITNTVFFFFFSFCGGGKDPAAAAASASAVVAHPLLLWLVTLLLLLMPLSSSPPTVLTWRTVTVEACLFFGLTLVAIFRVDVTGAPPSSALKASVEVPMWSSALEGM